LDPTDVIGQTIRYTGDSILATVTGIVHALPPNSELIFQEFISYASFSKTGLRKRQGLDSWPTTNSNCQVMLKISERASKTQIEKDINILRSKYIDSTRLKGNFALQTLTDIHFDGVYGNFKSRTANRSISNALILVALFLILLGCVNFINLSTANAPTRAKEIGIRKTLGSLRSQLTVQFIIETFLIVLIAMVISVLTMPLFLKLFKDFIPEEINLSSLLQPHVIIFFIVLVVLVTLTVGVYPAVILSSFNPVTVLKGSAIKGSPSTVWMRKGLTLFQLITAQVFILGTLMVLKQVNFLIHKDPGFNKDAVLNVETPLNPFTGAVPDQVANVFKEKLKSIPGIELVSRGSMAPSSASWSSRVLTYYRDQVKIDVNAQIRSGDSMFLNLYQIPILAGRSPRYINDSVQEFVINETMAAQLGVKDYSKLIGTSFGSNHHQTITGVSKDFNMKSLHEAIEPMVFTEDPNNSFVFHLRMNKQIEHKQYSKILDQIKTYYQELFPKSEFYYFFLDEEMNKFYAAESHIAKLIRWCMGLAIFICCLGLLGMVLHTVQTRVKEVGVRKVLGASIPNIIQLLMKDFVVIFFLSMIIAAPLVYLLANKWLNKFAYRTEISWWIFPVGGVILMVVTSITLSFNILRAARANPMVSLRSE
ncbi:MAG: FtsX-like permease family protein, partial [Saprospiraceae bacterium]